MALYQLLAQVHAAHRIGHPVIRADVATDLIVNRAAADDDGERPPILPRTLAHTLTVSHRFIRGTRHARKPDNRQGHFDAPCLGRPSLVSPAYFGNAHFGRKAQTVAATDEQAPTDRPVVQIVKHMLQAKGRSERRHVQQWYFWREDNYLSGQKI